MSFTGIQNGGGRNAEGERNRGYTSVRLDLEEPPREFPSSSAKGAMVVLKSKTRADVIAYRFGRVAVKLLQDLDIIDRHDLRYLGAATLL